MASAQAIQASCQARSPRIFDFLQWVMVSRTATPERQPHSKFAFSSILVRRTKNEQTHFTIDKPTLPQPKKRRFSRPNLFA
jgi:hypothetical protein